jgi:hypothetical protein
MPLPNEITAQLINDESNAMDATDSRAALSLEIVDDAMCDYFDSIVDRIATRFKLTDEQRDELEERLCWKLDLIDKE